MTTTKKSKPNPEKPSQKTPYVSSRQWAEERLTLIRQMQDEYLDSYQESEKESVTMLKLLVQIQTLLEKRL